MPRKRTRPVEELSYVPIAKRLRSHGPVVQDDTDDSQHVQVSSPIPKSDAVATAADSSTDIRSQRDLTTVPDMWDDRSASSSRSRPPSVQIAGGLHRSGTQSQDITCDSNAAVTDLTSNSQERATSAASATYHSETDSISSKVKWYEPLQCNSNCEDPEDYKPGGFFVCGPGTDFGDINIVHKLGFGGSSTVWLARDEANRRYVALKIYSSSRTAKDGEDEIIRYQALMERFRGTPMEQLLVPLYEYFVTISENGDRHLVLVLGITGPSISALQEDPDRCMKVRPDYTRMLCRRMAEAVQQLNEAGLVWSDLNASNIALGIAINHEWTIEEFYDRFGAVERELIQPLPGKEQEVAEYGLEAIFESLDFSVEGRWQYILPEIKCIDFGDSLLDGEEKESGLFRVQERYTDPETVFWNIPPVAASDTWALATLFFELRSGMQLFDYRRVKQLELEAGHIATIGPCPRQWLARLNNVLMERDEHPARGDFVEIGAGTLRASVLAAMDPFYTPPWQSRKEVRNATEATFGYFQLPLARLRRLWLQMTLFYQNLGMHLPCPHMMGQKIIDRFRCNCGRCQKVSYDFRFRERQWRHNQWDLNLGIYEDSAEEGGPDQRRAWRCRPWKRTLRYRIEHIGRTRDSILSPEMQQHDGERTEKLSKNAIKSSQQSQHADSDSTRQNSQSRSSARSASDGYVMVEPEDDALQAVIRADYEQRSLAPVPVSLSEAEARDFEDVLLMMLTWYRRDRAAIAELLKMPWLDLSKEYSFENGNSADRKGEEEPWLQPCDPVPRMSRDWYLKPLFRESTDDAHVNQEGSEGVKDKNREESERAEQEEKEETESSGGGDAEGEMAASDGGEKREHSEISGAHSSSADELDDENDAGGTGTHIDRPTPSGIKLRFKLPHPEAPS